MRFREFLAFGWIFDSLLCSVFGVDGPVTVQKIYVEKNVKNDLATEASGYIFRSDGDNPPILIKLGANNINQYEDVLKNAGKPLVSINFMADKQKDPSPNLMIMRFLLFSM